MSNGITRALVGIVRDLTRLTGRGAERAADIERGTARFIRRDVDEKVHADHRGKREIERAGEGLQAPEHGRRTGPTPKAPVRTGLGKDVDALVALSPTLSTAIRDLQAPSLSLAERFTYLPYFPPSGKWKIAYGKGKGTFCEPNSRRITIGPDYARAGAHRVLNALAHEVGHARLSEKYPGLHNLFSREGMTRTEWVRAHYGAQMRQEGEAELTALDVRKEILGNGGPDIYPDYYYGDVYERYERGGISRHEARGEVAKYWGAKTMSTTGETYLSHYGKFYEQMWDQFGGVGHEASDRYRSWFEPL
ncbi:hypothetical protein [Nocardia brasiliensis]|uniref:hypothetical protein n=1 Tax=Nocardia brasiliensis TaxID=37326 RepID=UPI00245658DD|nr:hypothetical protein [Nocardia brasiliensis]